ncbi:MAG: radical SAM protein [Candidatus Omnitrophota bacterium]
MPFYPEEILFSPTTDCNLSCPHCSIRKTHAILSAASAKAFLSGCRKGGIDRVGFTGGEPFLARNFLYSVVKFAVKEGFFFTRIVTNGVWYKNDRDLEDTLHRLFKAGYDGAISISVDAYHKQHVDKLARFIKTAQEVWRRPDLISIIYVTGKEVPTRRKLSRLARLLGARLEDFGTYRQHIGSDALFIKIAKIGLSAAGRAGGLKAPWDGKWFKEDYCEGPGNVFFVEPSGEVKPCCGYASESPLLSVGNINKDSLSRIRKNIRQNRIVCAIFNSGLSGLRKRLVRDGVKFPGRASDNCFFCHYILERYGKELHSLYYGPRHI